jgi:hypothetical protein
VASKLTTVSAQDMYGTTESPSDRDRLAAVLGSRGHTVTAVDQPADQPELSVVDYARLATGQAGRHKTAARSSSTPDPAVLLPAQAAGASAMVWLAAYAPTSQGAGACSLTSSTTVTSCPIRTGSA